jgi:hypothetical protein
LLITGVWVTALSPLFVDVAAEPAMGTGHKQNEPVDEVKLRQFFSADGHTNNWAVLVSSEYGFNARVE